MEQTASKEPMTVEDLYRLPDDAVRCELVHGRLVREPAPGAQHGLVAATLARLLGNYAQQTGHGVVLTCDTGFILHRSPDTVRAPDVSFISRERYLSLDDVRRAVPGPPDLAIEVLSPSNRAADIHAKVADYLTAGTTLVWVADPQAGSVTCFRNLFRPETLTGRDRLTAEDLLPGFSMSVQDVFDI